MLSNGNDLESYVAGNQALRSRKYMSQILDRNAEISYLSHNLDLSNFQNSNPEMPPELYKQID